MNAPGAACDADAGGRRGGGTVAVTAWWRWRAETERMLDESTPGRLPCEQPARR